jgi:TolB-like protein/DNA-binding SARP family transcriptional activator
MDAQVLPKFQIRLFGGFAITSRSGEVLETPRKILRALISLLALPPQAGWTRDELTNLLWGTRDDEQARASLRQALAELRRYLGTSSLVADRDIATLDGDIVSVDVSDFEQHIRNGRLSEAKALFSGSLLDGVSLPGGAFSDWLMVERARLDELAVNALRRLLHSEQGEDAAATAERLLRVDPCSEEAHRALMMHYVEEGQRSQALRQYQLCRERLRSSLGVAPEEATERLHREIQSGRKSQLSKSEVAASGTGSPTPTANGPLFRLFYVAAACLLLIATGTWWFSRTTTFAQVPMVAVLPFEGLAGDADAALLARGLTEDTITDLARVPEFRVLARDSTAGFAGNPVDPVAIGEKLNVQYLVQGSVQRQAGRLRVLAQLVDATTGKGIWSQRWDRPNGDLFSIQAEISQHILNRLGGGDGLIQETGRNAARRKPPSSLSAYEFYLLGTEKLEKITREDVDESIRLLTRAVELDPGLARAWVELYHAHAVAGNFGNEMGPHYKLASLAAKRAIELDPGDAEALAVYAMSLADQNDLTRAKAEFDKALQMAPNQFEIVTFYVMWASTFGEPERGAAMVEEAIRLNPSYPMWADRGFASAYFMAGRYEEALKMMDRVDDLNLGTWLYPYKAGALAAVGRIDEARKTVEAAIKAFSDLTIEGRANEPGYNTAERRRIVETMRLAGFPPCARPEVLAKVENPIRLEECK